MVYDFDLGVWSRRVTTASPDAQVWFDRGLNWLYGYNHEEAVTCFRKAIACDPGCAMAWWGVAYASGPFYNRPWIRYTDKEIEETLPVCYEAAQQAGSLSRSLPAAERMLAETIILRYRSPSELDRSVLQQWHEDFTHALAGVHAAFPDDPDVAALYSEAAITCTPRQLWNLKTGAINPEARTDIVVPLLEKAIKTCAVREIAHPGLLHIYIHTMEMSPEPERALAAADQLRGLAPDAGHLEHMPAHIYVLCGDYAQSVEQSRRAVRADNKYLAYGGAENFYTTARCHDLHLYMYAAMFLGQFNTAIGAADRIRQEATTDLIAQSPPFMASILDGYSAMRTHVLVRFGRWRELAEAPAPTDPVNAPIQAAMHAYGQGVANAALKQFEQADDAAEMFYRRRDAISREAIFLSNPVHDMLAVGEAMMMGEISYHRGNYETAFDWLRLAVARDDSLNYTEPWAWMHPPRHALGALLAEQGHYDEAETAYREDLGLIGGLPRCCQHPDNVWALHGLMECLERRGDDDEASYVRQRLNLAQARTDVPITSSCCCRQSVYQSD